MCVPVGGTLVAVVLVEDVVVEPPGSELHESMHTCTEAVAAVGSSLTAFSVMRVSCGSVHDVPGSNAQPELLVEASSRIVSSVPSGKPRSTSRTYTPGGTLQSKPVFARRSIAIQLPSDCGT